MTCIVTYVNKKTQEMWMGSDGLVSDYYISSKNASPKIMKTHHYLIGHCGYQRVFQIIQHVNTLPEPTGDIYQFMCIDFVEHLKKILDGAGYLKKTNETVSFGDKSTVLIVGIEGRFFEVYENFQVNEFDYPYYAAGSGREVALGSLYNDNESGFLHTDPRRSIHVAIKAAGEFIPSVGGKTTILSKKY